MFGIFGFIFSLIIIFIYSIVYAALGLIIIYTLSKRTSYEWIKQMMNYKLIIFINLATIFGLVFLVYHFSYWRDSGYGDSFKIPIGNNYQVSNIDGAETYFEDSKLGNSRQAFLTTFTVEHKKLCANFTGFNSYDCTDCYIVFDSDSSKMYEFHSTNEYETFAKQNNLPFPEDFRGFMDNYNNYWTKNSRWYLP